MYALAIVHRFSATVVTAVAAVAIGAGSAAAVTIRIDYTYDANGFFPADGPGRAALTAAAEFYSSLLGDSLDAIATPAKFYGSKGGEATWYSKRKFTNPTTGVTNALLNPIFDADEFVVYVGARNLNNTELGIGGPGSSAYAFVRNGEFTADELTQVNATNDAFSKAVISRGETSGFGAWGGAISFDSVGTTWHFDHTTAPGAGEADFYSVALHELAHTLGFGTSEEWKKLVSGTDFTGSHAKAANANADMPLASGDDTAHWEQTSSSTVYGGTTSQTPLMVPSLGLNTTRELTDLDAGALVDLGWEIDLDPASALTLVSGPTAGSAGIAALSVSVVPEPATTALVVIGAMIATAVRPRRR